MIELEDFVYRLCRVGADRGPRRFPRKRADRAVLMKSIVMGMDSGRHYSEPEVNDLLREWKRHVAPAIETDHVTIRRLLVDHGQLERTADGRAYRVGFPPRPLAFDLEIEELDLRATVAAYREHRRRRRSERRLAGSERAPRAPAGPSRQPAASPDRCAPRTGGPGTW